MNGNADVQRWVSGAIVVLVWIGWCVGLVAAQADAVAVVEPVQGLVQWHDHLGADDVWETLGGRQLVAQDDRLRTGSDGLAVVTFFDRAEVEILPGSIVVVDELAPGDAANPQRVSLTLLVGETMNAVHHAADPGIHYQIDTPAASAVVRGTEFLVRAAPTGETLVSVVDGLVEVTGLDLTGTPTRSVAVEAGQVVEVAADGAVGPVEPGVVPPAYPVEGPIMPLTCGDGVCEPEEEGVCLADCDLLPACGDQVCDPDSHEDPISCPEDCAPRERLASDHEALIHFFWAEGRCDLIPDAEHLTSPVTLIWGVGCFDSPAHAAAHPHPADYQLVIDGRPAAMSSLRQSGPNEHNPQCPWGWNFDLGPLALEPGQHQMILTETITDTWTGNSGGRIAGQSVTLTCEVTIAP